MSGSRASFPASPSVSTSCHRGGLSLRHQASRGTLSPGGGPAWMSPSPGELPSCPLTSPGSRSLPERLFRSAGAAPPRCPCARLPSPAARPACPPEGLLWPPVSTSHAQWLRVWEYLPQPHGEGDPGCVFRTDSPVPGDYKLGWAPEEGPHDQRQGKLGAQGTAQASTWPQCRLGEGEVSSGCDKW